jgi:hypothetical protein
MGMMTASPPLFLAQAVVFARPLVVISSAAQAIAQAPCTSAMVPARSRPRTLKLIGI